MAQLTRLGDYSNHLWLSIKNPTKSEIAAHIPSGFTNRIEVLVCTNLLDFWWTLAATNILTEGTDTVFWTYEMAEEETGPVFVVFGNADIDSDEDGIKDAREKFLHHTSPDLSDTDADGAADGAEVVAGTNPLKNPGDTDQDGLSDDLETVLGTDPDLADTDQDWVSDGYEYEQDTDPLDDESAPALRMEVDDGELYAKSTTLEIRIRGLVADELILAEVMTMENSITNVPSELVYFSLNGDENGSRSVCAVAVRGGTTAGFMATASIILDTVPPYLSVMNPSSGLITADRWVRIEGLATDGVSSVCVKLNGGWADGVSDGQFWKSHFTLSPGTNLIDITGADDAGNCVTQSLTIVQDLSLDTNAPVMSLDLPSNFTVQGGATNWNYGITTFGDETNLAFRGSIDDETAVVNVMVESPLGTNGPYNVGVGGGTQVWGEVILFEGSNQLMATAADAAGNVSTCLWSVIRDTSFVFRITSPLPWQVVNGNSVYVTCVADTEFSNAVVTVNGQAASVVAGSNVTFRTDAAVPLGDGVTKLSACAVLNGQSYYADPDVTTYEITRSIWKNQWAEKFRNTPQAYSEPEYYDGAGEYQKRWDKDSQVLEYLNQGYVWKQFWDGTQYTYPFNSYDPVPETNWPGDWTYFGLEKECWNQSVSIGSWTWSYDCELRFIKDSMIKDKELVLLQFPRLDYGRAPGEPIDPTLIKFKGNPGFWYKSNVTFLATIERDTEYAIRAKDFDWPRYDYDTVGSYYYYYSGRLLKIMSVVMDVLRVGLAMDGDRDGFIRVDDGKDKKYLFWVNDDKDVVSGTEEDDSPDSPNDCDDNVISCKRDLEDFTRVGVFIPEIMNIIPGLTYYLVFSNTVSGSPTVNVFEAESPTLDYLSDDWVANEQLLKTRLLTVGATEVPISGSYITPGITNIFLLEGKNIGKGQLTLVTKQYGKTILSDSVDFELRSIKEFYEKYMVTAAGVDDEVNSASTQTGAYTYRPGRDEYLLFVHGWNLEEWEKERWAETMFKRLWWLGYDGHCGLFSWPTLDGFQWYNPWDSHHYDHSELRSWNSAVALLSRLQALNAAHPGQVRVIAHSMGNVVSGEALSQSGSQIVHTFLSTQAAIPAHCFDNGVTNYWSGFDTPNVYGFYTSGAAPDNPYLASVSVGAGARVRLYNFEDFALTKWQLNNSMKPDLHYWYSGSVTNYNPGAGDRFYYDNPLVPFDERTLTFPNDHFEAFAFGAESRSQPLGAETTHVSPFGTEVNLHDPPYNFDDQHYSHSREFRSNLMQEQPYWEKVTEQAGFILLGR